MKFLYPIALLGLLGIPLLILIYIIKNQYTEQTIPTTFIWNLSEKFLKKKRKVSQLKGLIMLIIQCLLVLLLTLIIAHPQLIVKGGANQYCFILDGSASMNIESNGEKRFDKAKNKIREIIDNSYDGSSYTLVYVGNTTSVIYENLKTKEKAIDYLDKQEVAYLSNSVTDALGYAQKYFEENRSSIVYLVSDKEYDTTNIELINVESEEKNYGVTSFEYEIVATRYNADGSVFAPAELNVNAHIYSSSPIGQTICVKLYVDGVMFDSKDVVMNYSVEDVDLSAAVESYDSIDVVVDEKDALDMDNTYTTYNVEKAHEYSALIVSDAPFYLKKLMEAFGVTKIDTKSTKEYSSTPSGYGLYVYDSYVPDAIPSDGAIWLFDQRGSVLNSGFSYKETITPSEGEVITLAKGSTSIYKKITDGMNSQEMYVREYSRYGTYREFTPLLTCGGDTIVQCGTNNYGNIEVLFGFDLHNTNLPLTYNYLVFFQNLLNYSFPDIIEESNIVCGEELTINVVSGAKNIRIETPLGNVKNLDTKSSQVSYKVQEVGTYKVIVYFSDYTKTFNIYSSFPSSEYESQIETVSLAGERQTNTIDGVYDNLMVLYILLALLFVADWVVYNYEQHQL